MNRQGRPARSRTTEDGMLRSMESPVEVDGHVRSTQEEPWIRVEGDTLTATAAVPAATLAQALSAHLESRKQWTFLGDRDQIVGAVDGGRFWVRIRRPLLYGGRWDRLGSHVFSGAIEDEPEGRSRMTGTLRVASDLLNESGEPSRWSILWMWRLLLVAVAGFLLGTAAPGGWLGGAAGAVVGVGIALMIPWVVSNAPRITRRTQIESIMIELARVVGDAEAKNPTVARDGSPTDREPRARSGTVRASSE